MEAAEIKRMESNSISRQNRGFDRIEDRIPEYRGYAKPEWRMESDRALRKWLVDQNSLVEERVDELLLRLVDAAEIDLLPSWEKFQRVVTDLGSRVRGALRSRAGLFTEQKLSTAELQEHYFLDNRLIDRVLELVSLIADLNADVEQANRQFPSALTRLEDLELAWEQREDAVLGME